MKQQQQPGLGELLRYVGEMVEQGAEDRYREIGLEYRARYTPVLRAMRAGAQTIGEVKSRTRLTQGAISQTVSLMEAEGLMCRYSLSDGRKSGLRLTAAGKALVERLEPQWAVTFQAIAALEKEIGHPLRRALEDAASALEQHGFAQRLAAAQSRRSN